MIKQYIPRILLVLVGLMVLSGMVFFGVDYMRKSEQVSMDEAKIESLNQELVDLEKNVLELEVLFDDKDMEVSAKNELLRQSYDQVRYLEQEIVRLKREGKVNKARIAELEQLLTNAKANLLDRYVQEIEALMADNRQLTTVLDSILAEDEVRAERYRNMMQELALTQQQKDSLYREKLIAENKLKAVTQMVAANFRFYSVANGSEQQDIAFRAGNIDDLKVEFDILGNGLAEPGVYDLYMIIWSPSDIVMSNPAEKFGGNFNYEGKNIAYSNKTSFNYTRTKKSISMGFHPAEEEPFNKGKHRVQVFCKGEVIGEAHFEVI